MTTCRQENVSSWSTGSREAERDLSPVDRQELAHERRRSWRVCVWLGLILSGAVATFLLYLLLDEPVRQWFLAHPNTWHEHRWVNAFRQLGKAFIPLWLVSLWSCLTNRWRITAVTLMALLFVGVSVCPLKVLTSRRRPNDPALLGHTATSTTHGDWDRRVSFPSGDAAAAFAIATVLALSIRRPWAWLFLAAAGAVGLLRITSLAHYPSDVLAGTMIGILAGWWSTHLTMRWFSEYTLTISRRGQILLGVLLVVFVPLLGVLAGMEPLLVFLRFYGAAIAGLVLIGAAVHWSSQRQARRSLSHEANLAEFSHASQLGDGS
jgi:membrane-associated phospholipid phosphatase